MLVNEGDETCVESGRGHGNCRFPLLRLAATPPLLLLLVGELSESVSCVLQRCELVGIAVSLYLD